MKLAAIKNLWVRRAAMLAVLPLVTFQYMYLGLKSMVHEFRFLWSWVHPDSVQVVTESNDYDDFFGG